MGMATTFRIKTEINWLIAYRPVWSIALISLRAHTHEFMNKLHVILDAEH